MLASSNAPDSCNVLCVDLDGTLIWTDMLQESILSFLKRSPFAVPLMLYWLARGGRPYLKRQLAERVTVDAGLLPYNSALIVFLTERRAAGQRLALVSASDQAMVQRVAQHVGLFDGVHGSDGVTNLKGRAKLKFMQQRYGPTSFGYIGDSRADRPIWRASTQSYLVRRNGYSGAPGIKFERIFEHPTSAYAWLKALRIHQWVKNLLVFVPLILAHVWNSSATLLQATWAFVSLCLCASAIYIVNDLLDLESDRLHPRKCRRPFASGALALSWGYVAAPLLLLAGLGVASLPAPGFIWAIALYIPVTLAYSLYLKRLVLVDILVLAGLYSLRLLAGALAIDVPISEWTIAFAMFMFLSLASVKRYSELVVMRKADRHEAAGRGYRAVDLSQLAHLGTSAGYISVLVLALYIHSAEVIALYTKPQLLWLLCPLILYWVSRIWFIAHRGELDDDPIVFALRDRASYLVAAMALLVIAVAV